MLTEPKIVERAEEPYVAIRRSVPMGRIGPFIEESLPRVHAHLAAQGTEPAGPPFLRLHAG